MSLLDDQCPSRVSVNLDVFIDSAPFAEANWTIKDATVKRYHYDSHDQLRMHLGDFVSAYKVARRLKTLRGLTSYEFICNVWQSNPERFRNDSIHQMPGLNA